MNCFHEFFSTLNKILILQRCVFNLVKKSREIVVKRIILPFESIMFWNSENPLDKLEEIERKIIFACELRIHYLMMALLVSIIAIVLLSMVVIGIFITISNVEQRIATYMKRYNQKRKSKSTKT